MKLTPAQIQIARDKSRFRVVNCGRRFGKTSLAVEEIKGRALYTDARIVYIAPTHQQARDIAWGMLNTELNPIIQKKNEQRLELLVNNLNGKTSLIQLRGWEAIETLRGQKFDFMIIDEVASMRNFWEKWHEVLRPTLSDTRGSVLFISTPKGFNHFYDLYNIEVKDKDYKSFHYTSYDNPYIPKDEIDKAKIEMTENRFYQEYMADFRKQEGLVYKEFEREKHLYDNLPEFTWVDKISGVDFGYVNPTGIVLIHKDKKGCYWIDNEVYRTGLTNDQIVNAINALRPEKVYPDPEAPDKIDELRRAGIPVWDVTKGKDSIVNGITKIKELFKADRIKINRKCVNLINELESYAYDPDTNKETPIAEKNHLLDAMRYAITMNEQSPIIEKIQDQFWIEQMRHRNLAGFE
jgi:PBSX family phage terminase large subunit